VLRRKFWLNPASLSDVGPSSPFRPRSPLRVLVADDQPLFLETLATTLELDGLDVVGMAHDGREAARLADLLLPDLVLMDLDMPVMDGIEATRRIREALPSTRIVIITGSDSVDDVDRARRAGAAGYVTKDRLAADLGAAILAAAAA
jgi:DNA-binding NarL/FixJ family response regulator